MFIPGLAFSRRAVYWPIELIRSHQHLSLGGLSLSRRDARTAPPPPVQQRSPLIRLSIFIASRIISVCPRRDAGATWFSIFSDRTGIAALITRGWPFYGFLSAAFGHA